MRPVIGKAAGCACQPYHQHYQQIARISGKVGNIQNVGALAYRRTAALEYTEAESVPIDERTKYPPTPMIIATAELIRNIFISLS